MRPSYKLGTGLNVLDVRSATAAQVAALTTTPGATVAAKHNEIIVNDCVATTTSAATFANIKGFEILTKIGNVTIRGGRHDQHGEPGGDGHR